MSETEPHSALTRLRQAAEGMTLGPFEAVLMAGCSASYTIRPPYGGWVEGGMSEKDVAGIVTAVALLRVLADPGVREGLARLIDPDVFRSVEERSVAITWIKGADQEARAVRLAQQVFDGESFERQEALAKADAVLEWLASSAMKGAAE